MEKGIVVDEQVRLPPDCEGGPIGDVEQLIAEFDDDGHASTAGWVRLRGLGTVITQDVDDDADL